MDTNQQNSKPTRPQEKLIVHICPRLAWEIAQRRGIYRPEDAGVSEFIHCASPDQVLWVANRWFAYQSELLILWIDPVWVVANQRAEIRWEESDGDCFPHIYGPLSLDAVIAVRDFTADADGVYRRVPEI